MELYMRAFRSYLITAFLILFYGNASAYAASVTITSPNGGENWVTGTSQNITWTSSDVTYVQLEYSTNNGTSWTQIVASMAASAGFYSWTVPNLTSSICLVRITSTANSSITDQSNGSFTIIQSSSNILLTVNGSRYDALIDPVGETDWYRFSATSGTSCTIEIHPHSNGNTMDTIMYLYDRDGVTQLAYDDDGGVGNLSKIVWICNLSGTYFIKVMDFGNNETGYYSITVSQFIPPYNLTASNGTYPSSDGTYTDRIYISWSAPSAGKIIGDEPAEKRALIERMGLSENPLYKASATGGLAGLSGYDVYRSTSQTGTYTIINTSTITNTNYTDYNVSTGTSYWYYAIAKYTDPIGQSAPSNVDEGYVYHIAVVPLIVNGDRYDGQIETLGGEDSYSFNATSGSTYTLETHAHSNSNTMDTSMYLYDRDGFTQLEYDDDAGEGFCSKIILTCTSSGTYFIKVIEYNNDSTGDYSISVSAGAQFAPPVNLTASDGTYNDRISISWSAPSAGKIIGDEPAEKRAMIERMGLLESPLYKVTAPAGMEGLSGYNVYRSTSENGTYTMINSSTINVTNYSDYSVTAGAIYWYYATSVYTNPSGESTLSNKDSGYISSGMVQITVGGSRYDARIGVSGEQDWYWFSATSGIQYTIETHAHSNGNTMDTVMWLYDRNGTTELASDDDSGEGMRSKIIWMCGTSGTYYIKVGGFSSSTGDYSVSVSGGMTLNPPTNLSASDGTYTDRVYISWSAPSAGKIIGDEPAEKRALIERMGLSESPLYKISATGGLAGLSGYDVYRSTSQTGTYTKINTSTITNIYYSDYNVSTNTTYWYYAKAKYTDPTGESEPSNIDDGYVTPGIVQLTVGGSRYDARIEISSGEDWYLFTATSGIPYTIETHAHSNGNTMDTVMYLYDRDGVTQLAYDDDGGEFACSKITWTCTSAGTYYIKVRGFAGGAGDYSISVSAGVGAPYNLTASDGTYTDRIYISWSAPSAGKIIGDEPAEKRALIERMGLSDSPLYKASATGGLAGLSGYDVYRSTSQTGTYTIINTNTITNTYYNDYNVSSGTTYWYYAIAKYINPTAESGPSLVDSGYASPVIVQLTVGGSWYDAQIGVSGEQDWYRFSATSGTQYTIETHAHSNGSTMDTVMWLYDRNGTTVLLYDDDGGVGLRSQITWTCGTSGTYYIKVGGLGSYTGYYSVSVSAGVTVNPPTNLSASDGTYTDRVYISWSVPSSGKIIGDEPA